MEAPSVKSSFVTVLAWSFIVLGALSALMAGLQTLIFSLLLPDAVLDPATISESGMALPPAARWILKNLGSVTALTFLASVVTLTASIGLLKRHNWARLVFIALMVLAIIYHLAGLFLLPALMPSSLPSDAPVAIKEAFDMFTSVVMVMAVFFSLVFSALFAWVIWRLCSAPIVAEFRGGTPSRSEQSQ